jgi:cytochrome d ubiquinol oxidase subunit II
MTEPTQLQTAAFVLIGLAFCVYAILDGFDLGIGMLLPWLGKTGREKSAALATIAPVWDGNEVWLIMGGAYLFAFFPAAFGAALSILSMPVLAAVIALMLRAAAFEFRYHGTVRSRALWDTVLCLTSWTVTLILGIGFGTAMAGLDVTNKSFGALVASLLSPLPLATGAAGCGLFLLHGIAWFRHKAPLQSANNGTRLFKPLIIIVLAGTALWAACLLVSIPSATGKPLFWAGCGTALMASILLFPASGSPVFPLPMLSALSIIGAMTAALGAHFPNIVRTPHAAHGPLTVSAASSSPALLSIMVPFCAVWIALIMLFTVYVYRAFKGRAPGENHGY